MQPTLIFDLDGTLVDSLAGISASLNRTLEKSHLPTHSPAAVRNFIGDGARVLLQRAAPTASDAVIQALEQDFKADYSATWPNGTAPFDGIPEALAALAAHGFPLAVLSNKPHEFTATIVAQLFPDVAFVAILGQRSGIPHKPDPAGALEIAKTLGVAPADCLVIGDSTMDLDTARNAGMRSIAVTWGYHDLPRLLASDPSRVLNRPAELAGL